MNETKQINVTDDGVRTGPQPITAQDIINVLTSATREQVWEINCLLAERGAPVSMLTRTEQVLTLKNGKKMIREFANETGYDDVETDPKAGWKPMFPADGVHCETDGNLPIETPTETNLIGAHETSVTP